MHRLLYYVDIFVRNGEDIETAITTLFELGHPGGQLKIVDVSSIHEIGFIWNLDQGIFQLSLLHWKFPNVE